MASARRTLSLSLNVLVIACQSPRSADKRSTIAQTHPTEVPPESAQYVRDERIAVRIADSVLIQRYGRDQVEAEKPLRAALHDTIWTVTGTLPSGHLGGVASIDINRADGRVIRVTHGL